MADDPRCAYCGYRNGETLQSTLNGQPYGPKHVINVPMVPNPYARTGSGEQVHQDCLMQLEFDRAESMMERQTTGWGGL